MTNEPIDVNFAQGACGTFGRTLDEHGGLVGKHTPVCTPKTSSARSAYIHPDGGHFLRMDFHTPACASRSDEEWGLLLIERHEGAPLRIVPLYGGGIWNAVGSRMRLRHTPRGRPGRKP